jgi:hypothetical protein
MGGITMENRDAWRALCAFAKQPHRSDDPREPWEVVTSSAKPKTKSRRRKITVDRAMRQAAKAGLSVSAATITADGGVELRLGEPQQPNPWDSVQ